jgi:LCP family protein required for cell wall assembly
MSESETIARPQRRRVQKARKWKKRLMVFLIILVSLLVILSATVFGYYEYRNSQRHPINVGGLSQEISGQPINILLVGNNSRCILNNQQTNSFGTCGEVGGARSDVTMLLHLDPANKTVSILSIPRDSFVHIPNFANPAIGRGPDAKIDGALNNGPTSLVTAIEQDYGIPIQHYISLNFDTFQNVVNILGGINMYFPTPVYDLNSGLNIKTAGCQHLNGTQALAVVRSRELHYLGQNGTWQFDGNGDISRIVRVHEFLRVLAAAIKPKVTNPFTANALVGAILPQLQVDNGLSLLEMAQLGWDFHNVNPNSVPSLTLPTTPINSYEYQGANYGDVVFPVQPADQQVIQQFLGSNSLPGQNVDPSSFSLEVENGTGAYNLAQKTAGELSQLGFNVVSTANAPNPQSILETTVYYSSSKYRPDAEKVLDSIAGTAIMAEDEKMTPNANVTIVVGNQIEVNKPAPSSTSSSQVQSTSPTSSSEPTSSYKTSTTQPIPSTSSSTVLSTGPVNPTEVYPANQPLPWFDPRACFG